MLEGDEKKLNDSGSAVEKAAISEVVENSPSFTPTQNYYTSEKDSLYSSGFYRSDGSEYEAEGSPSRVKKTGVGIGVISLLFVGGFGLFGLLAQPLQFLQMSSMLRNFHFSDGEDLSDNRMVRVARYIKYDGDQRTRLGLLGNKYANRIEIKLNDSGLKSTYDGKGSVFSGYDIDIDKAKTSGTFGDISNKNPEQIKDLLIKKYRVSSDSVVVENGKIKITTKDLNTFETKRLLRDSLKSGGYSKLGAAMRARIMGKRAGVTWNPIKKLDTKITASPEARISEFIESRKKRIRNGSSPPVNSVSEQPKDSDGDGTTESDSDSKTAADSANKAIEGPSDNPADNVKNKIVGKVGGAAAVVGILCIAKALNEQYDSVKHANVVLPLMRLGVEGMAVGNQVITGQNLDPAHIDAMTKLMYDENTGTSWRTAKSIQYEAGEKMTGKDILDEAKIDSETNVFRKVIDKIPALNTTCSVFNSTVGSWTLSLLSGGPIAAIAEAVAEKLVLGPLLNSFANWLAGNPINIEVAGADYGNYINYGAKLAANDTMIASGGRKLNDEEVAELKRERIKEDSLDFSSKSMFAKIFDYSDYRTALGGFMSKQTPNPTKNIARVVSIAPKALIGVFSPFKNILTGKVSANTESYDYGFDEYGFSRSEIDSNIIENPFENDEIVANMLDSNAGDWSKRTSECFGVSIVKRTLDNKEVWMPMSNGSVPNYIDVDKANCEDASPEFLRIRMWIHDSQLMSGLACFEDGSSGTCDEFGFSASLTGANGITNQLNCEGYLTFDNTPAAINNDSPEGEYLIPYSSTEKAACESLKSTCATSSTGSVKAICAAIEFDGVYYGGTGMTARANEFYGFSPSTNALHNVVDWVEKRKPGLNPYNLLECSALTSVAAYKAFGYSSYIGCSGVWSESQYPNLFKSVSANEIMPGDFLSTTKGCNLGEGAVRGSHIVIAASAPDTNGNLVIYESSAHGTTTHFRDVNVADFVNGNLSRWIGPGI